MPKLFRLGLSPYLGISLAIGSLIIGVLGIVLAIYYHNKTLEVRSPVFLVDPIRTAIADSDRLSGSLLNVSDSSGLKVEGDVSSLRMYFWNQGSRSIKTENVLEPIKFIFDSSVARILDYRIVGVSRDLISPSLKDVVSDHGLMGLELSFLILEKNDGVAIQVIYEGPSTAGIYCSGTIEGVEAIGSPELPTASIFLEYLEKIGSIFVVAGLLLGLFSILILAVEVLKRLHVKWPRYAFIFRALAIVFLFVPLMLILLLVAVGGHISVKKFAEENISETIPQELR